MTDKPNSSDGRIYGKTITTAWNDTVKVAVTPEYIKYLEAKVRYVEMERDEARDVIDTMADYDRVNDDPVHAPEFASRYIARLEDRVRELAGELRDKSAR